MMQGTIKRIARHRVEPRGDARLPMAWIGGTSQPAGGVHGTWLTRGAVGAARAADGPALVLLGEGAGDARASLLAHATSGTRVYALVGPGWGKSQADSQLLQAFRVLVRRVPEVPATGVHIGHEARLWLGGDFALRLDDKQAEALRQTFLRLFWHEATEEAWSADRQLVWRPARERPFDVPEAPSSAPVRWERPDARLTGDARGALMHLTSGVPPEEAPKRLWFPAGPNHQDRLARLAQAGAEVLWDARGLPDMLVSGGEGEVLLPGQRGRLRLRLTQGQASEVARLLSAPAPWQLRTNVRLGDGDHRSASFWLSGEGAARKLEAEQLIEVPEVQATSLRAALDTEPASVPPAQPLALAVRYQWTVVPPRAPTGAEEDALVGRWRRLDEDWTARLARVREALAAADGDRGRIGLAFSRLVSAMLGFARTHSGLLDRVEELEGQRPSRSGPTGALPLLDQLARVEEAARKLQTELDETERKAREDAEREKQQTAWQKRVEEAHRDLPDRRTVLATIEGRQTVLEEELRSVEDALKSADKESRKDLTANRHKLSDDLQRASKGVARLRGEIKALEQQAAEQFEFRPQTPPSGRPAQPGGRFVPPSPSTRAAPNVPEEALPEVGSLRHHKAQRYLVIKTWEELTAGEKAASRLSAKLVAPENA